MPGLLGKTTNWQQDIEEAVALDERNSMWGEIPGEVVSFNPSTQTATIQPLYKPKFNGKAVDMPQLLEVPVRFARAGNGGITFPVGPGDKVTLRPMMRSSENYHTDGDGAASDARSFNLSDMEAFLEGGESASDPIPNFDPSNVHVRFDPDGNFGIRGSADGKVKIEGSEGNIYDMLARLAEMFAEHQTVVTAGSSAGQYDHDLKAEAMAIAAKLRAMAL